MWSPEQNKPPYVHSISESLKGLTLKPENYKKFMQQTQQIINYGVNFQGATEDIVQSQLKHQRLRFKAADRVIVKRPSRKMYK
mmetsp:Transcript_30944/g.35351  ORF Transcript_30944/g.35351 Transcript_30944/m.35351 type:complete len:83 (+) Transcript_30944:166-414(+)